MSNEMISVPHNYVLRLTPEAHSTMLGMVEHCLNVRACMGMDEGFKDLDTEEEHDFVKELRALLAKSAQLAADDRHSKVKELHDVMDTVPSSSLYSLAEAVLDAGYTKSVQHQGEPVARIEIGVDRNSCLEITDREWLKRMKDRLTHQVIPLYTRPAEQPAPAKPRKSDSWSKDWREQGFNYCIETAIKALKYLADHPRPIGGESRYNAEHLIMTAQELALTRQELLIGRDRLAPVAFPGYPPVPEDRQLPAPVAVVLPEPSCRQRLAAEGKPYPRSSCGVCGPFSPKWRECDALIEVARLNPPQQ